MKQIIFLTVVILGIIIHFSCQKKFLCPDCDINKPPIANAGPDQTIILPKDSTILDGTNSSDPDGKIGSYKWAMISGPFLSNIIKNDSVKTPVKGLVIGVYQFELNVTDDKGAGAKDTVQILVNTGNGVNHPPVACAGLDQVITLPTNSVNLNGSCSTDPDNNITIYAWTKISGPASFTIVNANAMQTQVTNLVQGVYQFELKVTDAGGLFSKDTVQVIVTATNNSLINLSGCNSSMIPFGHLSMAGDVTSTAAAGSKIFFSVYNGITSVTNIYDTITKTWSTSNLAFGNINIGTKLIAARYNYPVNQELFEIYDAATGSFTTHTVPEARAYIKYTVAGNKVVFSGGSNPDSSYMIASKRIDIYDGASNSWSLINFDEARYGMAVASIGNKLFFAGGFKIRYDSLVRACDDSGNNCIMVPAVVPVNTINIYDLSTSSWSIAHLSEPRAGIVTAVVGNKILFAGGGDKNGPSTTIDIYNASGNNWSTSQLLTVSSHGQSRVHTVGNKVLFVNDTWLGSIDIYDAVNNSCSTAIMSKPSTQTDYLVASRGNKIVFFIVFDHENYSQNVDMYDASANTWCHTVLNRSLIRSGIIGTANRIYIAGGTIKSNPNNFIYDQFIDDAWIFDF